METNRLKLIPCTAEILTAAIEGNEILANLLAVHVPEDWTEFGASALSYSLDKITAAPEDVGWWTYFPIHKKDNTLIGSGGYVGQPDKAGFVEIGYEIAPTYRNQGFATEMTRALVEHAFQDSRVKAIQAHTLAEENPSTKVLAKCGFEMVGESNDPDEGPVWRWEVGRGA